MTDLPFGRGGSPLQNLIERGIYETKLSALRCCKELDGGDIYLKRPLSLWGTAEEIYLRAAELTKEMMIETVKYLNILKIDGIKIHMLNIIKDTPLEKLYNQEKFHVLTKEEYIDIVTTQLQYLNPKIVIHRITSDPDPKELIEPTWLIKKFCLLNDIDKYMKKNNIYQGKKIDE